MCCGGPSQAPHNTSSFIIGNADLVAQVWAELAGRSGTRLNRTAQRNYTSVQQQQQQPPPHQLQQQQHGSVNQAGQQGQQSPGHGGKPDQDRQQ